jgi:multidrug efflux system membrane fusion protein
VEIELPNADGAIPDGISADVAIPLAPIAATRVPRSALTFSSTGDLGVRTVDGNGIVGFMPVNVIEDEQTSMWLGGVPDGGRVIVQGQDFVREGQHVEAVPAAEFSVSR